VPYLLDSDIVSATIAPRPNLAVVRRISAMTTDEYATSAISVGEMLFGALKRGSRALQERVEAVLEPVPVVPFDDAAARRYAELKVQLERLGAPLAEPDLRIAAIALAYDLTLVTGNERHFRRVPGLAVENWLSPAP
jgi:tRNA(fMet)-specific endonuclease VapC